jgi:hypothetical protein
MNDQWQPTRFAPGQDGAAFRRAAFLYLSHRYRARISEAIEILRRLQFELPQIGESHEKQLQPELLFRQSIPFCLTEDAYFRPSETTNISLAGLLAGHTLALTHLDYHLDGSVPDQGHAATARKMDLLSATTYAIRMIYAAGRLLSQAGNADAMFRDAFEPISGFVLLRMYEDWKERYCEAFLDEPERRVQEYLESPTSRLLGSGYWELMPRGCFISHGTSAPPELIKTLRILRKLRQVVDEIADFEDDVRSGLVTVPLMYALQSTPDRRTVRESVLRLWHSSTGQSHEPADEIFSKVRKLIEDSGAFEASHELAQSLWREASAYCERSLGTKSTGYLLLLDLKRAKLEMLAKNGWHNEPTEACFDV